ncbi:MAG TPA: hypothetical protein VI112_10705 [Bacteroidia bacterium]
MALELRPEAWKRSLNFSNISPDNFVCISINSAGDKRPKQKNTLHRFNISENKAYPLSEESKKIIELNSLHLFFDGPEQDPEELLLLLPIT